MKKISTGTIKAFLKEKSAPDTITKTVSVGDSSFDVQIRTSLTIDEQSTFISRVLSGCFDSADNFRPEYVLPMIHATILQMCSNVPVIALKNGQAEDGSALMDIDAMENLFVSLGLCYHDAFYIGDTVYKDGPYVKMAKELEELCKSAIEWRKNRILAEKNVDNVEALNAVGDAALAIRDVAKTMVYKVNNVNMDELTKYAGQLSEATMSLDEGGILKGLMELQKAEN